MTRSSKASDDANRQKWTAFEVSIYDWEPWVDMSLAERVLWWALMSSRYAKRWAPGLWQGGPAIMAEAARMDAADVATALSALRRKLLIEFDERIGVARLTQLPLTETWRPHNGKMIRGWWSGFRGVTPCAIRDSHVPTLRGLLGDHPTEDHLKAWTATFATVRPATRLRSPHGNGIGYGIGYGSESSLSDGLDTVSDTVPDPGSRFSSSEIRISSPAAPRDLVQDQGLREAVSMANAAFEARERERERARFGPRPAAVPAVDSNSARHLK